MVQLLCYHEIGSYQKDIWFVQGGCKMEYLAVVVLGIAVVIFGYFTLQQADEVEEKTADEVIHESNQE